VFKIGELFGYSPWTRADHSFGGMIPVHRVGPLDFESLWVPVKERVSNRGECCGGFHWSELFYLPHWLISRARLGFDPGWQRSPVAISLPWEVLENC
jgi:hypothetical protein